MNQARDTGHAGADVGGSGFRIRVETSRGSVERCRELAVPRDTGRVDVRQLSRLLLADLEEAMAQVGAARLAGLGVGLTGFPLLVDIATFHRLLRAELDVETVVIAGDALTTHVGALGGVSGAVIAAGTGAIALGTDLGETWTQVDGWGVLLGDEGSGAWIGGQGLRAALRDLDGRPGGSTELRRRLEERFADPIELVSRVYSARSPAHQLAAFAPAVADAARSGDRMAAEIWRGAGARLGQAVVAAARELPSRISWGGGLFAAGELLLAPFQREVRRALPHAELIEPAGGSVEGALLLARRAAVGRLAPQAAHLEVFTAA